MTTESTEVRQDELAGLRKKIAQYYFYKKYLPNNDALAYNLRWEDIPFDGCESSKPFYDKADQILSLTVSSGGRKCEECDGRGQCSIQSGTYWFDCLPCNGTGRTEGIIHTLLEWAELGMQLSLRQ